MQDKYFSKIAEIFSTTKSTTGLKSTLKVLLVFTVLVQIFGVNHTEPYHNFHNGLPSHHGIYQEDSKLLESVVCSTSPWFKLIYWLFGQSNMHSTLDFYPDQPGIEYRHSSISAVSISAVFGLMRFIILSYFPPLQTIQILCTSSHFWDFWTPSPPPTSAYFQY